MVLRIGAYPNRHSEKHNIPSDMGLRGPRISSALGPPRDMDPPPLSFWITIVIHCVSQAKYLTLSLVAWLVLSHM